MHGRSHRQSALLSPLVCSPSYFSHCKTVLNKLLQTCAQHNMYYGVSIVEAVRVLVQYSWIFHKFHKRRKTERKKASIIKSSLRSSPTICWRKTGQAISSLNETRGAKENAFPTLVPTVDNQGFLFSEKINPSFPHSLCSLFSLCLLFLRFFLLVEITHCELYTCALVKGILLLLRHCPCFV